LTVALDRLLTTCAPAKASTARAQNEIAK
jgi:hypothetical protein